MKVDKTESEFREDCGRMPLHEQDALIKALDLEFREEGEGLRKVGEVFYNKTMHCLAVDTSSGWRVLTKNEEMEAARRYNDFPELEALARELGKYIEGIAVNVPRLDWKCALLARLRELLPGEGA